MLRKWIARLAFSFIVIAFVCGYEAYTKQHTKPTQVLLAAGAAISTGLGLAGLRERQRLFRDYRYDKDRQSQDNP